MNKFGENKWPKDQRALDGLVAQEFEALEAAVAADNKPDPKAVTAFRDLVSKLTSKDRQLHWNNELIRLNLVAAPKPKEAEAKSGT